MISFAVVKIIVSEREGFSSPLHQVSLQVEKIMKNLYLN